MWKGHRGRRKTGFSQCRISRRPAYLILLLFLQRSEEEEEEEEESKNLRLRKKQKDRKAKAEAEDFLQNWDGLGLYI